MVTICHCLDAWANRSKQSLTHHGRPLILSLSKESQPSSASASAGENDSLARRRSPAGWLALLRQAQDEGPAMVKFRDRNQSRHLMEQPMEGICSFGPWPVAAISFIAS